MNKLHLLSIITALALVNNAASGIDQERKDITKSCTKVYVGGLVTAGAGQLKATYTTGFPYDMQRMPKTALQAISRAGYIIGSPITSAITTGLTCSIGTPLAICAAVAIPRDKIAFYDKPVTSAVESLTARSGLVIGTILCGARASVPAIVGFVAVPYTIQTLNNHLATNKA